MRFSLYPFCLVTACLLLLVQEVSARQWTYYGSNFMLNSYYDPSSIIYSENNKATVFIKQSYADRQAAIRYFKKYGIYDESNEYENHKIALMEIDCSNKAIGVKKATSYRENEEIISEINNETIHYVPIPTASLFDVLFGIACKP